MITLPRERLRLFHERKKPGSAKSPVEQKKEQSGASTSSITLSTPLLSQQLSKSFSSQQALNRSVRRAEKAPPFSPREKKEVNNGLVNRYQQRIQYEKNRGRKSFVLSEEEQELLLTFFDCVDITYLNPGGKENTK